MKIVLWSLVILIIVFGGFYLLGRNLDNRATENSRLMEGSNQPIPNGDYAPGEEPGTQDTNTSTWNEFDGEIGI